MRFDVILMLDRFYVRLAPREDMVLSGVTQATFLLSCWCES
jgi:hypothetical protein